jgi:hypothetical protein
VTPFLTLYTPTFRRPQALAKCLVSVQRQTCVEAIEQIVVVDHVGIGVGGMFTQIPMYREAVHGEYVHILADDDVLAGPDVVERVRNEAYRHNRPEVIVVSAIKGALTLPLDRQGPPVCGRVDLGCYVIRADVWKRHCDAYGDTYEGDFAMASLLWTLQYRHVYAPEILFLVGAVSRGSAEVAA